MTGEGSTFATIGTGLALALGSVAHHTERPISHTEFCLRTAIGVGNEADLSEVNPARNVGVHVLGRSMQAGALLNTVPPQCKDVITSRVVRMRINADGEPNSKWIVFSGLNAAAGRRQRAILKHPYDASDKNDEVVRMTVRYVGDNGKPAEYSAHGSRRIKNIG
jgi:hypothetical protein